MIYLRMLKLSAPDTDLHRRAYVTECLPSYLDDSSRFAKTEASKTDSINDLEAMINDLETQGMSIERYFNAVNVLRDFYIIQRKF